MSHIDQTTLIDFIYDELDKTQTSAVRDHIKTCETCWQQVNQWQDLQQNLNTWAASEPLPGSAEMILSRVERDSKPRQLVKREISLRPLLYIALWIMVLFSLFYAGNTGLISIPSAIEWHQIGVNNFVSPLVATVLIVFLTGVFITLTVAFIMILESRRKNLYVISG